MIKLLKNSLRHRFEVPGDTGDAPTPLEQFSPLRESFTDTDVYPHVNDSEDLDIYTACFMMRIMDLPSMFRHYGATDA